MESKRKVSRDKIKYEQEDEHNVQAFNKYNIPSDKSVSKAGIKL